MYCLFMVLVGILTGTLIMISSYADNFNKGDTLSVIVDAGHGLPDGGAVGVTGSIEQEINLKIALKLQEVLEAKGVRVIMTRTDENGLWDDKDDSIRKKKVSDMNKRLEIMKKSDAHLFISIHMNSFPNHSASGLRIFYAPNHEEIKPLAENIQTRIQDITGANINIVKSADKSLFLMKNPPIPAILVECGFLSNAKEEKKLQEDDYQARLAWAIADALEKYYVLP
ncbi:MAG: N-acetylmuramoyl-L-alanine amidase [Clostridia bacterium]|nr:N-acetylmuramoyl-L-alanine amidase [Clostridia bacterium]